MTGSDTDADPPAEAGIGPGSASGGAVAMRHAVLGDVGGHRDALVAELRHLGADPDTGTMPADLRIVQVGDLVHRGPASEDVVDIVDRFLEVSGERWVQIVGNHEAQYLRHPAFHWHSWVAERTAHQLRRWWADGRLVAAAVVPSAAGDHLVTHAGLTEAFWRRDLGRPRSASEAANRLNDLAAHGAPELFRPGRMLTGKVSHRAGPLWAEAGSELVGSWRGRDLPFSQVHGHSSLYDWQRRVWRASDEVSDHTTLDRASSHETTWLPGGVIVGIDPGHGAAAHHHWRAWEPPQE